MEYIAYNSCVDLDAIAIAIERGRRLIRKKSISINTTNVSYPNKYKLLIDG